MKTFKLTITEDVMRALIRHHANSLTYTGAIHGGEMDYSNYSTETSERIHTLTKRLNKDTPEIEGDPRPLQINFPDDYQKEEPVQATAAKEEALTSW